MQRLLRALDQERTFRGAEQLVWLVRRQKAAERLVAGQFLTPIMREGGAASHLIEPMRGVPDNFHP